MFYVKKQQSILKQTSQTYNKITSVITFNPNSKIQESFLNELNLYEDTFLFDNVSKNVIYYLDPTKEHYTGLNYGFGIGTWKTWHLNNIAKIII